MTDLFIAGATGYLGRYLVRVACARGWTVRALVRDAAAARQSGLDGCTLVEAQATRPESLSGIMAGADMVISALGITRQREGMRYHDVDYQANMNLLAEALRAGVPRFAYVHVLNADAMTDVPLVAAKQAFALRLSAAPIASSIIAPSGYFSDMADIFAMALAGRVWLFGDGATRMNPIHGADLAPAALDAAAAGTPWLDIGGPDILTHRQIAELAVAATGGTARITALPDAFRRLALSALPLVTPAHVNGPARFFLSAAGRDMVGIPHGDRQLSDHFCALAGKPQPVAA